MFAVSYLAIIALLLWLIFSQPPMNSPPDVMVTAIAALFTGFAALAAWRTVAMMRKERDSLFVTNLLESRYRVEMFNAKKNLSSKWRELKKKAKDLMLPDVRMLYGKAILILHQDDNRKAFREFDEGRKTFVSYLRRLKHLVDEKYLDEKRLHPLFLEKSDLDLLLIFLEPGEKRIHESLMASTSKSNKDDWDEEMFQFYHRFYVRKWHHPPTENH